METGTKIVVLIVVVLCVIFGGANVFKDKDGEGGSSKHNSNNDTTQ